MFLNGVLPAAFILALMIDSVSASFVVLWPGFYSDGAIGTTEESNQKCFNSAGNGWLPGGCSANKSFAFVEYVDRTYAEIATRFNFSNDIRVLRGNLSGTPGVVISDTWSAVINQGALQNPILGSSTRVWSGRTYSGASGGLDDTCNNWSVGGIGCPSLAYVYGADCSPFTVPSVGCAASQCCSSTLIVLCGCHYTPPTSTPSNAPTRSPFTSAPSKSPSKSPSTTSPTPRSIAMISTATTAGGCGQSTPNVMPLVQADNRCIRIDPTSAAKGTCNGTKVSLTIYDNDQGTCTSSSSTSYTEVCQTQTGPGPIPGSAISMGFGLNCEYYAAENLLQVAIYTGTCSSKSNPVMTYWQLNTCMTPPGLPTPDGILAAPFSMFLNVFGTSDNLQLRTRTWSNAGCSGSPLTTVITKLETKDGEAIIGCVEGNPHNIQGVNKGSSGRRRLQPATTFATEFRLFAVPSNVPLTNAALGLFARHTLLVALAIVLLFLTFL